MVTIVSRPSKTIPSSPANIVSRYTAAWNPIVYTFKFTTVPDAAYRLLVRVFEYGSNVLLGEFNVRPIAVGNMRVDMSSYIQSYLESSYGPDFGTRINDSEPKSVIRFYITYQEQFLNGTSGTLYTDQANYINAALSAKQIGDIYGQNMRDYTPFAKDGLLAKFLTKFDEPVKWNGWPFTLSFVFAEDIQGHEIKRIEENLNINKVLVTDAETQLDRSKVNYINWLKVSDNVPDNVYFIDVTLKTGEAVGESYVYAGYVEDGYVEVRD